jgi:hypothetical protein
MSSFARRLLAGRLKTPEVEKGQICFPELFINFGPEISDVTSPKLE